ncbi:MAG: hypothetical protein WCY41_03290 [Candidatus Micrarchaeia archaeon]
MGGQNKKMIKNCVNSIGRGEKDNFVQVLKFAPKFEYSREFEEKVHNMLRIGVDKHFSAHHDKLVGLALRNPFNMAYLINIYFSGDETVSARAGSVISRVWYGSLDNSCKTGINPETSKSVVESQLRQGTLSEFDITSNFLESYEGKRPDFEACLNKYCLNGGISKDSRELQANNPSALATEDMARKIISELKSGNPMRIKRSVTLLGNLPLMGGGLVSDGCMLELLAQLKPLQDAISHSVREKENKLAKTSIWANKDAVDDLLSPYWRVEKKFRRVISTLKYAYEKRTGAPAVVSSSQKQLPANAQGLVGAMDKE